MMSDDDLELLYKKNIAESHAAALRGIFDAGYALGVQGAVTQPAQDVSQQVMEAAAIAADPTITTA